MLFLFVFTSDNYLSSCVNSCSKLRLLDDELRLGIMIHARRRLMRVPYFV